MNNVIPMIDNRYLIIHADQPSSPTLNIKISAIAMNNEINKIIHDLIVRAICFLSFCFFECFRLDIWLLSKSYQLR